MDQEITENLAVLKAGAGRLKAALQRVPKAVLLWTPAPGKWSIQEIVCHMRDMERDAYQARYRRIMAEDNPSLPDIDGDLYALERDYRAQKLTDVVKEWKDLRKQNLKLLGTVKRDGWQRPGTHETAGPLTMAVLVRRHARGNDDAHLAQIDAIKQRHELLKSLEQGPKLLMDALRQVDPKLLRQRTADGKWSPIEHACHLRDIERVFLDRFTKIAHVDHPSLWMADNDRLVQMLRYADADPDAVRKDFARLRADTLTLLRALPHAAWQRTGLHPKRGEISIQQLAAMLIGHDKSHVDRMLPA